MNKSFAIIGAGFSGTMLATQMVKLLSNLPLKKTVRIILIEKEAFGKGAAYKTESMAHLLNVPAMYMSPFSEDPDHFLKWAKISPEEFAPRMVYADYLKYIYEQTKKQTTPFVELAEVKGEVISIVEGSEKLIISLKDGTCFDVDKAILALGNFPPTCLDLKDKSFLNSPRYIHDPWQSYNLIEKSENDSLVIIGTGLTTVDKLMELHLLGYKGVVHAISRNGLVPNNFSVGNCFNFSDLYCPISEGAINPFGEISLYEISTEIPKEPSKLISFLRDQMKFAIREGVNDSCAIYNFISVFNHYWNSLSFTLQKQFVRYLRPFWNYYAHGIPKESRDIVESMMKSEQLHIHKAKILSINEEDDGICVQIKEKNNKESKLKAKCIINCMGPSTRPSEINDPLIKQLLNSGSIKTNIWGQLIDTAEGSACRNKQGVVSDRLYAVGSLKKSPLAATKSVPSISFEIEELAHLLVKSIDNTISLPQLNTSRMSSRIG